jgi:hypothetical protein
VGVLRCAQHSHKKIISVVINFSKPGYAICAFPSSEARPVQTPTFPENNHPLITELSHYSDRDLLTLYQRQPDAGKYFVALFCRYSQLVFTLIRHSVRSPVQADFLFATTWKRIFHELRAIDIHIDPFDPTKPFDLQGWLIKITAASINQSKLPPVETIHYSLSIASPPLWCFVEQALNCLEPIQRLIVLMAQTFHWSEPRIAAYLQAEGDRIAPVEIKRLLETSYQELCDALPLDIREIYLSRGDGNPFSFMAEKEEDLALF